VLLLDHLDGYDALELLLGEQILPVLVLSLQLFVCALDSSLGFLKLADLLLKHFHFLTFFHSAAHRALPVLQAPIKAHFCYLRYGSHLLPGFLVVVGVLSVVVSAAAVNDALFQVLQLLLGEVKRSVDCLVERRRLVLGSH